MRLAAISRIQNLKIPIIRAMSFKPLLDDMHTDSPEIEGSAILRLFLFEQQGIARFETDLAVQNTVFAFCIQFFSVQSDG